MKNFNNFSHFELNSDESFEIKGGTWCSGNKYSSKSNCKTFSKSYSKPSYSHCSPTFSFSFGGFGGCHSKPKTCNPPVAVVPPAVEVVPVYNE